ncbi:LysR family glycine cleavage system transcriptional activator [Altererythrobacter atlanticus]|uniref:Glycine cleavage system transcriptional activator n=1 Tax=Croceibacterium atlanticum TaxID=1267766 RepID=A0A0F7KP28_9SPHN|nr:LysR family transcriptional regulator [Croceibacterium atlanticum]AKH42273.1 Glycine cleavage system transcriptional activator [Croceibacterium atlanticum]MBB5731049.1 LysR family glycine cleavage system transcriptional activator [Croceibacterium atlanticum]
MRRLPPLRALEAFVRVVRLGSARAASDELGLSPSALSRRIANLEDFTGKKMFSRTGQAMKLTDEGRAFYDSVAPHLEALAVAVEAQSENLQLLRLRLGVLPLFGTQRLFPRLPELRQLHPRLHIDIDTGPHLIDRVGDTLDAAIILMTEPNANYHGVQLDQNTVHAICNKTLAEELGPSPGIPELEKQTFLLHTDMPLSFDAWKKALGYEALQPSAIDHYDSGQLILEAAAQGLGVAMMHDDHMRRNNDPRLAKLFDGLQVESPYSYWFVCRPVDLETRPVRIFHDWLVKAGL